MKKTSGFEANQDEFLCNTAVGPIKDLHFRAKHLPTHEPFVLYTAGPIERPSLEKNPWIFRARKILCDTSDMRTVPKVRDMIDYGRSKLTFPVVS